MKRAMTALTLAMLAVLAVGCGGNGADEPAGDVYEARGIIRQLPGEAGASAMPDHELQIEHERVPNFKDQSGEIVGMDSMTMPFPPADDVSLDGLAVGDKVRFTFIWRWAESSWTLTEIEKLPDDTQLDLGSDAAGADTQPDHAHDH